MIPPPRIASLHLHPPVAGELMRAVTELHLEAGKGIAGEPRYFGRMSRSEGRPSRRQLSLIAREQIQEHADALGLSTILPGAVRANIETEGLELVPLVGRRLRVGQAILAVYAPRDPCEKMDRICPGLRQLMDHDRQGILAEIVAGGVVRVGDRIEVL